MTVWETMTRYGAQQIAEFGRDVVFRGNPLKAIIGQNSLSENFEKGGLVYSSAFSIRFFAPLGEWLSNNPPKQGEKIQFADRSYTITAVTIRKPSPWIDCSMEATDQ